MKKVGVVLAIFVFILSGCDWFIGPTGPAGPAGPAGTDGLVTPLIFVPAENNAAALAFSDRTLVSTGYNGSIYTSTDGVNWVNKTISNAGTLSWAAYGNGLFVTASETQVFYSSNEGASWDEATNYGGFNPISGQSITGLAAGTGTFVAVGNTGATSSPYGFIMRSSNGSSWTGYTPAPSAFDSVSYTNGQFIAVTDEGSVYISTDGGNSWSSPGNIPTYNFNKVKKIVYGNGLYLIVRESSLVSTPDFINTFTTLYDETYYFVSAAFHGNRFTVLLSENSNSGPCDLWFTDGSVFFWPAGMLPDLGYGHKYTDIQWVPWLHEGKGTYVISQKLEV